MGADGQCANECWRRREYGPTTSSARCFALGGLSFRPGGPGNTGKVRIWQRDEKPGLQTLAPRSRHRDRQVRKGTRALGEAHEGDQPERRLSSRGDAANPLDSELFGIKKHAQDRLID